MSKSNDISNIATLDDHHTLADSELDAVSGGLKFDTEVTDYVRAFRVQAASVDTQFDVLASC
jgi:hypothetical protein